MSAITTLMDVLDAVLFPLHVFARVEYDGSSCVMTLDEAQEYQCTAPQGDHYTVTPVLMTRRQFNNLPEFAGF